MTITRERKRELIEQYRRSANDVGSPEVQIAVLTSRIKSLTEHLKLHRKDFAGRRGMLMLVGQRRRLLDYLKRTAPGRYVEIVQKLELRK
ncbi:MAG: 30S ribosomal protein S15 [Thermogutta sp.]|nr:30S ribosomal protein S15 [Thermogutta sp.]